MSTVSLTRSELAAMIDHTLLVPEATANDVIALCGEGQSLGVGRCVSSLLVKIAAGQLAGTGVRVSAVIGFLPEHIPLRSSDPRLFKRSWTARTSST